VLIRYGSEVMGITGTAGFPRASFARVAPFALSAWCFALGVQGNPRRLGVRATTCVHPEHAGERSRTRNGPS